MVKLDVDWLRSCLKFRIYILYVPRALNNESGTRYANYLPSVHETTVRSNAKVERVCVESCCCVPHNRRSGFVFVDRRLLRVRAEVKKRASCVTISMPDW